MAQKAQKKGCHKAGRNKVKCGEYRAAHRRYKNKIRRILRHNGPAAADRYARDFKERDKKVA